MTRLEQALQRCREALGHLFILERVGNINFRAELVPKAADALGPIIRELCDEIDLVAGFWHLAQKENVRLMHLDPDLDMEKLMEDARDIEATAKEMREKETS